MKQLLGAQAEQLLEETRRIGLTRQPAADLLAAAQMELPRQKVTASAMSLDDRLLAVAGEDSAIRIWDTSRRRRIATLGGHTDEIYALAFSQDGKTLASGGYDQVVRIHRHIPGRDSTISAYPPYRTTATVATATPRTGKALDDGLGNTILTGPDSIVTSIAFPWGDKEVAAGTADGSVFLWDSDSSRLLDVISRHTTGIRALGLIVKEWPGNREPELARIVTGDQDGLLGAWERESHGSWRQQTLDRSPDMHLMAYLYSPDFPLAIVSDAGELRIFRYGFFDRPIATAAAPEMLSLAPAAEGKLMISGHRDKTLRIWEIPSLDQTRQIRISASPRMLASSSDGSFAAYASDDGALHLVDVAGRDETPLKPALPTGAVSLAFSPDSRWLAAAGKDGATRLWDVKSRRLKSLIKSRFGNLSSLAFSRDGRYISLGTDGGALRLIRMSAPLPGISPNPDITPMDKPRLARKRAIDAPPALAMPVDPEAYAVVIGIEQHQSESVPPAEFAAHDAQTVYAYLTQAMGFAPKNVVLLKDHDASKAELEKNLGTWLRNRITSKSRVLVYYAGHGSPDSSTGSPYLVPYDGDPSYIDDTGYSLDRLYRNLARLPTDDIRVVLDASFSGLGRRSLIAQGARPLVSIARGEGSPGGNTLVFKACQDGQASTSSPTEGHGLLTHFLLMGLQGRADLDHDGTVATSELFRYLRPRVESEARKQNIKQSPAILPHLMDLKEKSARVWIRSREAHR